MQAKNQPRRGRLREFWRSSILPGGVTKLETGIAGFDELLEGGLPEARGTLIMGNTGSGKTVLLAEYLYRGIVDYDQPGVFVTFEEHPDEILRNMRNFGWGLDQLVEEGRLVFVDASPPIDPELTTGKADWLSPMLARIRLAIEKSGARRLAIDNLGKVFMRYSDTASYLEVRQQLFRFSDALKQLNITSLISAEESGGTIMLSREGAEQYVCDGLIELSAHAGENQEIRTMRIHKLRGVGYRSGKVVFGITGHGIEVFPKIPIDTSVARTDFDRRLGFGVPELDAAMAGGIPVGHIMLVAGNTGSGKTTMALHFAREGIAREEPVIWVAMEEPAQQLLKTAEAHGWELEAAVENGLLTFVATPLMDVLVDRVLYAVIDAVLATNARRIVVDSISSLETASINKENVREFMLQLAGFAKTRGITVMLNYLTGDTFGAGQGQLLGAMMTNAMRLSSIVDGILILRYVERGRRVAKLLNILKLRGSDHAKDIFEFEIGRSGFQLGGRFSPDGG